MSLPSSLRICSFLKIKPTPADRPPDDRIYIIGQSETLRQSICAWRMSSPIKDHVSGHEMIQLERSETAPSLPRRLDTSWHVRTRTTLTIEKNRYLTVSLYLGRSIFSCGTRRISRGSRSSARKAGGSLREDDERKRAREEERDEYKSTIVLNLS